jgi:hypothetical protein
MNRRELMQAAVAAVGCAALPAVAAASPAGPVPLWAFSEVCGGCLVPGRKWLKVLDANTRVVTTVEVDSGTWQAYLEWSYSPRKADVFFTNITQLRRFGYVE